MHSSFHEFTTNLLFNAIPTHLSSRPRQRLWRPRAEQQPDHPDPASQDGGGLGDEGGGCPGAPPPWGGRRRRRCRLLQLLVLGGGV